MDSPIIPTLLDTDLYKYTMQQSMVHRYPDAWARMEFHCRNDSPLAVSKKQLKRQCEFLGDLRLGSEELEWLSTLPFIAEDFIDYLEHFRLDPGAVKIEQSQGQLSLVIEGLWSEITHFEIFLLAIISELYGHSFYSHGAQDDVIAQGQHRLDEKLDQLPDKSGFTLVDFGTRRRFSRDWHYHVVESLKHRLPDNFMGTSNLNLARTLGLQPVGTMAHEWLQSHQVLGMSLRSSQKDALRVWLEEYRGQLGIALTDTISMDAFLKDFDVELAREPIRVCDMTPVTPLCGVSWRLIIIAEWVLIHAPKVWCSVTSSTSIKRWPFISGLPAKSMSASESVPISPTIWASRRLILS